MITVGITNHNYGRFLAQAINSATAQGAEVIVVDNGSTDNTAQILSMYEDAPNVKLLSVESPTNTPVDGYNIIIDHARGDYLIFLDADDTLAPGALKTFVDHMGDADWIYSDMNLIDDDGDYLGMWDYSGFPRTPIDAYGFALEKLQLPVPMKGMFRTSFIKDNGLRYMSFGTTFHAPDFRTCLDWLLHDPKIVYVQAPLYNYRYHPTPLIEGHREAMESEVVSLIMGVAND